MDESEQPGLLDAQQVIWLVANDLDPQLTEALYGSPPIGIEILHSPSQTMPTGMNVSGVKKPSGNWVVLNCKKFHQPDDFRLWTRMPGGVEGVPSKG